MPAAVPSLPPKQIHCARRGFQSISHAFPIRRIMNDSRARYFQWTGGRPGARWPVLLLLLVALPFLRPAADAQLVSRDNLKFEVSVGFGGVVPEADWFPVVCEVRNEGPSFNAIFEFQDGAGGGLTRQLVIELPTGTPKRFSFPMFAGNRFGGQYSATLRDEKGQVVAQVSNLAPGQQINWQSHLLAALPATAAGMPGFPEEAARNFSARPVAATSRVQPELFPDNPLALEGLDSLYLNSQLAVVLKERQIDALMSWLHAGGHLLVGLDALIDVTGVPWLKSLMPGELGSPRAIPVGDSFDRWLRARPAPSATTPAPAPGVEVYQSLRPEPTFNEASLRAIGIRLAGGGRIELAADGTPLIVSQRAGRGKVTVLLFNPELEPVRSWKLRPFFWARVAGVPGVLLQNQPPPNQGSTSVDGVFGAMVDSRQIRKLPVSALLGLLVVYLLVIGPLDQWWLKKINRQMLTWITFPAYVVLFSVLIWVIGYKLRAGESEWNELQIVDVIPKGTGAELRGTTYASLYSPVNASYALGGRQRFAALRNEYAGTTAARASDGRVTLNGDQYDAQVNVPVWTSQVFVGQWLEDGPLPFSASLTNRAGGNLEMVFSNHTLPAGATARIALGDRIHEFAVPAARQTATIPLPADGGTRINEFANAASVFFHDAARQRNRGFGSDEARFNLDPAAASMAISLAAHINAHQPSGMGQHASQFLTPGRLDLSRLLATDQAIVMVWNEEYAPAGAMNQFQPRRTGRSSLLRLAVAMNN